MMNEMEQKIWNKDLLSVEERIKNLQKVKLSQLVKLAKYPVLKRDTILQDVQNAANSKKGKQMTESLKILDCPRERLLCKLIIDTDELAGELKKKSKESLRRKIRAQYLLKGDNFLLEHIPSNKLMKSWYVEITEKLSSSGENISSDTSNFPYTKDKLAYSIKYEPFCTNCKEIIGLADTAVKQTMPRQRQKYAILSFSTCRKGYCHRITLQSQCQLCIAEKYPEQSDKKEDENVRISIDPCIENQDEISWSILNSSTGIRDMLREVWKWIDEVSKMR